MASYNVTLYPLTSQHGNIPNNPKLPLLLYRQVYTPAEEILNKFKHAFEENSWGGSWTNGVYDYHHYHSTAHEVLGVYSGKATIIFGGPGGKEVDVESGDMVVIPAGVGHCRKWASADFKVVGAYPKGQEDYDVCTEKDNPEEKRDNIEQVALPATDPVGGKSGPLMKEWRYPLQ
ncbi:cupin domain-containing protein [Cesiribacter sp. SM1]|uniref:cupin domain-containing protein n=1 Tax=Cesiribacter sp. SM1 TaxID=2861196 RepID=UPI001CD5DD6D|nr:cupin domain-containing protein [Cesiribacter sp. SM1]